MSTRFWWGNLRERELLGRPRRRWEDNIKMDLEEVGRGEMGGACGTYGGRERCPQGFGGET